MNDTEKILRAARQAAHAGGDVLMRYRDEGFRVRSKSEGSDATYNLVSEADEESEQKIGEILTAAFPDHALLGEESLSGNRDAEHLWVIDPLDGTNNYIHDIPHFAVSIAYYRAGKGICGIVYNPATGDWFTAVADEGAWLNEKPIRVGTDTKLDTALVGCGFYYDRGEMMRSTLSAVEDFFTSNIHGMRRFGTAALDLCLVAKGAYGVYFEYKLSPWDFAAGRIIVEAAGGIVTDALGRPLPMDVSSILASNGTLHAAALEITTRHHL